jgi:hypothetical protein
MEAVMAMTGFFLLLLTPCLVAQRVDLDEEVEYDIPYPDRD